MMQENVNNVIVGMGQTGLSFAQYLNNKNIKFSALDSRQNPSNYQKFVELDAEQIHSGDFDVDWFLEKNNYFISPGVALPQKIKQQIEKSKSRVYSDLEIFFENCQAKTIAITGTNGKSTVVSLIYHILKELKQKVLLVGNIGFPALDYLHKQIEYDFVVIEISSYQIDLLPNREFFDLACILNIEPDHLERYESFEDYKNSKKRIYTMAKNILLNFQNASLSCPKQLKTHTIEYLNEDNDEDWKIIQKNKEYFLKYKNDILISDNEFQLKGGKYNLENILVAIKSIEYFIPTNSEQIVDAVKKFTPLRHRIEFVKTIKGIDFINDSKATNPSSVEFCLNCLKQKYNHIHLIMGGDLKNVSLDNLYPVVQKNVKKLYVFGKDKEIFNQTFKNSISIDIVENMHEAIHLAYQNANQDDVIVLSPACASLDMYANFKQRGDDFISIVNQLN